MSSLSGLRKNRLAKRDELRRSRLDIVVRSADSALRNAFLVNGGGAVALLAFFGQVSRQAGLSSSYIATALLLLVVGTFLAAVATGFSFLAQYGYMVGKRRSWLGRSAQRITALNIVLIWFSYMCFVVAGFVAYGALA